MERALHPPADSLTLRPHDTRPATRHWTQDTHLDHHRPLQLTPWMHPCSLQVWRTSLPAAVLAQVLDSKRRPQRQPCGLLLSLRPRGHGLRIAHGPAGSQLVGHPPLESSRRFPVLPRGNYLPAQQWDRVPPSTTRWCGLWASWRPETPIMAGHHPHHHPHRHQLLPWRPTQSGAAAPPPFWTRDRTPSVEMPTM